MKRYQRLIQRKTIKKTQRPHAPRLTPRACTRTFLFLGFALGRLLFAAAAAAVGSLRDRDTVRAAVFEIAVYFRLILLALTRGRKNSRLEYSSLHSSQNSFVRKQKTKQSGGGTYRWALPLAVEASKFDFERSHFLGLGTIFLVCCFRCWFWLFAAVRACRHETERQRGQSHTESRIT